MSMHPEYPQNVSAADFTANFTTRPPESQAFPGSYYYNGGYNPGYQTSADAESRRNVPWQGPAYQGQQMPYQSNAPQYGGESQIQPFSSYGGSGRPEPNGLNGLVGRYSMPYQSAPSPMPYQVPSQFTPQPQYPQYPTYPTYPTANFNNTPQPVRSIGTRPNDCWTNSFVAPREVQPPQIDWNQRYQNGAPVGQFEYFTNTPQIFDTFSGNPNMQMSWTDQWFKNKGVYFK